LSGRELETSLWQRSLEGEVESKQETPELEPPP